MDSYLFNEDPFLMTKHHFPALLPTPKCLPLVLSNPLLPQAVFPALMMNSTSTMSLIDARTYPLTTNIGSVKCSANTQHSSMALLEYTLMSLYTSTLTPPLHPFILMHTLSLRLNSSFFVTNSITLSKFESFNLLVAPLGSLEPSLSPRKMDKFIGSLTLVPSTRPLSAKSTPSQEFKIFSLIMLVMESSPNWTYLGNTIPSNSMNAVMNYALSLLPLVSTITVTFLWVSVNP